MNYYIFGRAGGGWGLRLCGCGIEGRVFRYFNYKHLI